MTTGRASPLRRRARSAIDWAFRDRQTGRITVGQFPNASLATFLGAAFVGRLTDEGTAAGLAARWTATGALAWWAVGEVRSGVNPWRRSLGVVGGAAAVARAVGLLA